MNFAGMSSLLPTGTRHCRIPTNRTLREKKEENLPVVPRRLSTLRHLALPLLLSSGCCNQSHETIQPQKGSYMSHPDRRRKIFVYSEHYELDWLDHVFPVRKYRLLRERLLSSGDAEPGEFAEPAPAAIDVLILAHTHDYVSKLRALAESGIDSASIFEAPLNEDVWKALLYAAGGSMLAAELALENGCAMNLCGGFHHAGPDFGGGFCFINDVAVAIRHVQRKRPGLRVAIADCDLHQGDGTAVIFENDDSVFTFSIHQQNIFPPKQKSDLDIGLPDDAGDTVYLANLKRGLEAVIKFKPELIVYLAGADPFKEDQLGTLEITKDGLKKRDCMVFQTVKDAGAKVMVVLAGGYSPDVNDVVDIHHATANLMREICGY